jgi:hypothetical protein
VDEASRQQVQHELTLIFDALAQHNAEFGFRTAREGLRFVHFYGQLDGESEWLNRALDAQLMQKVLPRLNGARARLAPVLWALSSLCRADRLPPDEAARQTREQVGDDPATAWSKGVPMRYPMSAEKLAHLWAALDQNGFASFMEA